MVNHLMLTVVYKYHRFDNSQRILQKRNTINSISLFNNQKSLPGVIVVVGPIYGVVVVVVDVVDGPVYGVVVVVAGVVPL